MADDHLTSLAERFVALTVRKWEERGLPAPQLSAAMMAWALNHAVGHSGHAQVAESLQVLADGLMIEGEPAPPQRLI